MHFKLAFIGFGTVGQGLTEILLEKKDMLAKKYDFHYTIVAISDITKGSVYDEKGLNTKEILNIDSDAQIIIASGDGSIQNSALQNGVKRFLKKPFSSKKLLTIIEELSTNHYNLPSII